MLRVRVIKLIQIFLKSLIIGYSGALMPGSLLTYTIDKSIRNGAKAGLIISIGHALLELILVLLLLFGFGRYLGTELAKTIIGIAGGLVLSLFGIKSKGI
jgi:threonine/homoserine/homoserine lactone efflux protein